MMKTFFLIFALSGAIYSCDNKNEAIEYYDNGIVKVRTTINDHGHKNVLNYSDDGTLQFEYLWLNSEADSGTFISYYENGKVKEKLEFNNKIIEGEGLKYYPSGELWSKVIFESGKPIKSDNFDRSGVLYSRIKENIYEESFKYYSDLSIHQRTYLTSGYSTKGEKISIDIDSCIVYDISGTARIKWRNMDGQKELVVLDSTSSTEYRKIDISYENFITIKNEIFDINTLEFYTFN